MMLGFMYYTMDNRMLRDWWEFPIPKNDPKPHQVVAATIKSPLSRKREPESDPVRLEPVIQVQVMSREITIISQEKLVKFSR